MYPRRRHGRSVRRRSGTGRSNAASPRSVAPGGRVATPRSAAVPTRRRPRATAILRADDAAAERVRAGALSEDRDARRPARPQRLAARAAGSGDEGHLGQLRVPLAGRRRAARRRGRRRRARRRRRRRRRRSSCRRSFSPGSTTRVVAIALGYGRAGTDRFAQRRAAVVRGAPAGRPGRRQRRAVRHRRPTARVSTAGRRGHGGQDRRAASAGLDAGASLARAAGRATETASDHSGRRRWRR